MFSKLKVIDLSTVLAGPSVCTFFAELGAEVIKVENPNIPDTTRSWKLASEDKTSSISAYFSSVNYKKNYLKLDLKNQENRQQLLDLLSDADIVVSNFKKGDVEKFQLTDSILHELNPRLIHGKITGYGSDSDRVAYDLILQAESGFMSMNGTPESGPVKMPVALIDILAGHQLKQALLIALLERMESNQGKSVQVSLYDAAICSLSNQASNYLMTGEVPKRMGSLHPNIAPYGELFQTADSQTVTFAIGSDKQFRHLCEFLDCANLIQDARFVSNQQRIVNRTVLAAILAAEILKKRSQDIVKWAEENFVPAGIVRTLDLVLGDEEAKRLIRTEELNGIQTKRMTSIAFH